jgi:acyl carrier protein
MELQDFISAFAEQFDDTEASVFTADCRFHDLEEWSSLISMGIIALVRIRYGKSITNKEIRECVTLKDLFNLIKNK